MPRNSSNRDLLNMIDNKYQQVAQDNPQPAQYYLGTQQTVHTESQQALHHRPGSITITTTAGGKHQPDLSPSSSQKKLHQSPSQRRLQQQ